ncbi:MULTISPECIES: hypothetical protein [unclassified Sphingomonas]|uniref:hypothetical protein n=1 Tax=unclassified Sphingomonas TaxID=196159 RepID=UPI00226A43D2|nr:MULTISPECIES: hypothetical protein [unclassified Sphingomonas]
MLILLVGALSAWLAIRGLHEEPHGAAADSDALQGQAARATHANLIGQPTSQMMNSSGSGALNIHG